MSLLTLFGCGGGGSSSITNTSPSGNPPNNPPTNPTPANSEFRYQATATGSIDVSALSTDTGGLTSPMTADPGLNTQNESVPMVSALEKFLYLEALDPNTPVDGPTSGAPAGAIYCFSINSSNGGLTPLPGSPFIASIFHVPSLWIGDANGMVVDNR